MKEVVIFGGAGYIGSHVVKEFLKGENYHITIADDFSTGRLENFKNLKGNFDIVTMDISYKDEFSKLTVNPDIVVDLAACKHVDESMKPDYIHRYADVNVTGTVNILNWITEFEESNPQDKVFIFSSSAATFGNVTGMINSFTEQNPCNFYGWSKYYTEQISKWYNKVTGLNVVCLRYFNAAGYDEDGDIGGIEIGAQNLIPVIVETALGKRPEMSVFGTDWNTRDGTCIRDYIHVTDLARAHVMAASLKGWYGINLGTGKGTTVKEAVSAVRNYVGYNFKVKYTDRRIGDPEALTTDYQYAESLMNWKPLHSSIENIVKTTIKQYKRYFNI